MDLGSNNNTLSLTGGDTTDDIGDSIVDLETRIATNETDITDLQTNLTTEASTRLANDTTLQTNIDAEETARIAGDNALTTYVDNSILNLIDGAGDAYDTLLELKNEIQANDTELNQVFTNVATKVSKSGDTMTGNLLIESTTENPKLTLWSKLTGAYSPSIDLVRNSATFGADGNYDWRIINDGGTFKLQTQGTSGIYNQLRDMININAVGVSFTIGDTLTPLVLDGDTTINGSLTISNPNEIYYKGQTLDARFHSLDTDYYTEAESDARFLQKTGGTITGNLQINGTTTALSGIDVTGAVVATGTGSRLTTSGYISAGDFIDSAGYIMGQGDLRVKGGHPSNILTTTWNTSVNQYEVEYPTGTGLFFNNALSTPSLRLTDTEVKVYNELEITQGGLVVSNNAEIEYKGQTLDNRFVNTAGDTMTGLLNLRNGDNGDFLRFNSERSWLWSSGGSAASTDLRLKPETDGKFWKFFTQNDTEWARWFFTNNLTTCKLEILGGSLTMSNNTEINYKGQTLDNRFVNVTGDTMTGDLSVGGELTINDILTFDKAKCKTTSEIFEDNIINSTALATGTWHRIMTAGNNVGGTIVIALNQSGRHCYYEIKFSNSFWEESSLRVVNHHSFGVGANAGVSAIRVQSATSGYFGTAFDIYTNNSINGNEITINLKNAYTQDDYSLVDFTPNPTDLNSGVDIKTLELDLINTAFGGVRADRYGTTISDFRFSRTGLLTASSANITGDATINNAQVGEWSGSSTFACFSHDTKNTTTGYALLQSSNGATYLNANSGNELSIRQGNSPRIDIAGNGDVSIANNLSVGVDMSVAGKYEVGSTPLITQVHSFIQTDFNPLNRYRFFTHSPNLDSNNNNPVFGIKSVGRIIPYALVMGCDGDGETATDFTFQIRARTDTSNIANLTTGTTTLRGTATINDIEENQTKKVLFTGASTIFDDQSWGLYLSNMNPDGFDGEIIVKVYFYQVA